MGLDLGRYVPGNGWFHRLDPRGKILGLFLYGLSLLLVPEPVHLLALGVLSLIGWALAGLPWRHLWAQLGPLWFFLLVVLAMQATFTPGTPMVEIGPLSLTWEGLHLGLIATGRVIFLLAGAALLTATTTPLSLTQGLQSLLRPAARLRLPVEELTLMLTLALRFVPTLAEEAERIMRAQAARGFSLERRGLLRQGKNLLPLLIPLFVSTLKRAEDLAQAMEARGYQGGKKRTLRRQLKMAGIDYLFVALNVLVLGLAAVWHWR
ncbi:MAG: energy-coupling factor transporter transmembrane component T family protein [Moorellaceae bacterium]